MRRTRLRPPTALAPYLDHLQQRWDEGEHNAAILHRELATKGYRGHYQRVKVTVASWRETNGIPMPSARAPSPLQVARWIITPPERRGPDARERLRLLFGHCPELAHVHELVREFTAMLDQRDATGLAGSTNSPPVAIRPWSGWRRGSARTRMRRSRGSPLATAPE